MESDTIAYDNFKLEAKNIIIELDEYHSTKKRQIEHCFAKLLDNIPKEIIDLPINQCIEDYLRLVQEFDQEDESEASDMTGFDDAQEILDKNYEGSNLTSTVKKITTVKPSAIKNKLESAINEQSIIQKLEMIDTTISNSPIKEIEKHGKSKPSDQYLVRIIYFLKDYTQVSSKLQDLSYVDMNVVHENCAQDLKTIIKALPPNTNRNHK